MKRNVQIKGSDTILAPSVYLIANLNNIGLGPDLALSEGTEFASILNRILTAVVFEMNSIGHIWHASFSFQCFYKTKLFQA